MRLLLALLPVLLWSQQHNTGSIRGQVRYDLPPEHVHAYLINQNGASRRIDIGNSMKEHVQDQTQFQISDLEAGTYVIYIQPFNSRGSVKEVMVKSSEETSLGQIYSPCDDPKSETCDQIAPPPIITTLPLRSASRPKVPVLTVCEALEKLDEPIYTPVVIVGRLAKSGTAATLTGDCSNHLITGTLVWPNAISLFHGTLRKSVAKGSSAYYGRFIIPSGFISANCPADPRCNGPHMAAIPAAVMGPSEKDTRAIR